MGLSVAISGGIILTVFMLILFSLPGLADKMFSIGDITTQVTQHEQEISKTVISMDHLSQLVGTPRVNFTLNNDGAEKLWNFKAFNLFIGYDGAISGKRTEQLSYSGECLGAVPPARNWCIESISNDLADQKILNFGEKASIRTNLSQNLASTTAIVTLVTDNGVTFQTSGTSSSVVATILAANVTASNIFAHTEIFSIPLTENSGNVVKGVLVASTSLAGNAVQATANVTNANSKGWCYYRTPTTATAIESDALVLGTATLGAAVDTQTTIWLPAIETPLPITFECTITTGATAGNLRIFIQPEVAGTATAKAGSFYIKTP